MGAVLFLCLVAPPTNDGLGHQPATAAGAFAVYIAVVCLLALPGGWISDDRGGLRRCLLWTALVPGHTGRAMVRVAARRDHGDSCWALTDGPSAALMGGCAAAAGACDSPARFGA